MARILRSGIRRRYLRAAVRAWRLLAALVLLRGIAAAQEEKPPPPNPYAKLSIEELLTLDITSVSKKAEKLLDAAAAVYVLTGEDIRRSGLTSLSEVLRMAPGAEVARINGNSWAIACRGFNEEYSKKLLVLVDGRMVYAPVWAGVMWDVQDIPLQDLERIEVVRGPGGALWGANAMNGVINVISKSARETQGGYAEARVGTEERGQTVRYGGKIDDDAFFRVYMKYTQYDETADGNGRRAFDAWNILSGGFRADWFPAPADQLTLDSKWYRGGAGELILVGDLNTASTSLVEDERALRGGHALARWKHAVSEASDWSLQLYYDRVERDDFQLGMVTNVIDLDFQHRFRPIAGHEIVWGLGYRSVEDNIHNSDLVSLDPRSFREDIASAFLQDEIALLDKRLHLILGSKFEYNNFTGFEFQPSGRIAWTPDERQTLWAAVSRAVRTPSRMDRDLTANSFVSPSPIPFPPVQVQGIPNRDIVSEHLMAYEIGYRVEPMTRLFLDATAFYDAYTRLIVRGTGEPYFEMAPIPHLVMPQPCENDAWGATFGGEVSALWQALDVWSLTASYSALSMRINSDALSAVGGHVGDAVAGLSPRNQVKVRSRLDLPQNVTLDASLYFVGRLKEGMAFGANQSPDADAYTRLDVRLGWKPLTNLEVSVVGQNLLRARHEEFVSYYGNTEMERSVYACVALKF
jgi:iron complex outermembrane receptor protein